MAGRRRISLLAFVLIGLASAVVLVVLLAPRASSTPDGLSRVAADTGIDRTEQPHALEDGPLAGYAVEAVDDDGFSTVLAGTIGVAVTFVVCAGTVWLARRRRDPAAPPPEPAVPAA